MSGTCKTFGFVLTCYILIPTVACQLFTPVVFGMGAAGAASIVWRVYKYYYECCSSKWIAFNSTGLNVDLKQRLFGQHVASRVVLNAMKGFMNNNNNKKPLVLSLHGLTGTGKNFVSQLIAENIYKKGMDSSFIHQFVATVHFPHKSKINTYKSQLQRWIKGNVTNCPQSMFIFDEMDKMHPGLIDTIKPYVDYYKEIDGVSFNQAIFIFLSNAGGEMITEVVLDFRRSGKDRADITLKDLEKALSLSIFNNKESGFWHTSLIDKNLVDFFIPFLPLEYQHVVQCGMAEMATKGLKPNHTLADLVAKDMIYFPKSEKIFSSKGCKSISSKLDFYRDHA
ncbi:hypothetical protein UPYG_G00278570 [Umbra pygmaea]|uniref:Torsin n=1 Tax=Umbra pygmaea TaxID=75934 RepID=A0ABD0W2Q1_UMBPY